MTQPIPSTVCRGPDPKLLTRLAWECRWSDRARSAKLAQQALDLALDEARVDFMSRTNALRTLAWQAKWRGDFEKTSAYCVRAKQRLDPFEARHVLVDVYSLLGVVHYSAGRRDFADRMIRRGFELLDDTVPPEAHVDLYTTNATVLRYRGRLEEARESLETALKSARGAERARVNHNIARALNHDASFAEAAEYAETALQQARKHQNRVILPYALEVLGTALIAMGQAEDALPFLEEGQAVAVADQDRRAQCQLLNQAGLAQRQLGNFDAALILLTRGCGIADEMEYPIWLKSFWQSLGDVHEQLGDFENAAAAYKTVIAIQNTIRD